MSATVAGRRAEAAGEVPVLRRLSALDRFLPAWILGAMALGIILGRLWPGIGGALGRWQIRQVSIPIAVGLLWMMYPVLAKVRYERISALARDWRMMATSLALNWIVGPALMFALAWLLLPDEPAFRTGLILVGLARCIAMVLIWNQLAGGDGEYAAVLVAVNSVFQIVSYAGLAYFYVAVLPGWLGLPQQTVSISPTTVAASVGVFLGVPLLAGFATRLWLSRARGLAWYEQRFLPRIGPTALWGLLFTIVVMFALKGNTITAIPLPVARIMVPLLAYFALMFTLSFLGGRLLGFPYPKTATLAFTAASNNFELAIAAAVAVFGIGSGQALAAVVGPLVEVPVLVGLVYLALWAGPRLFSDAPAA
ncbi:MAG: ACR3 family arsenite efflux transporter [Chloroflexota bacterium]|nr:ACR3 family arsenite efflux transporter [Chloroflexota bacterium]